MSGGRDEKGQRKREGEKVQGRRERRLEVQGEGGERSHFVKEERFECRLTHSSNSLTVQSGSLVNRVSRSTGV